MGLATRPHIIEPPRELVLASRCIREAILLTFEGRIVWASERFAELSGHAAAHELVGERLTAWLEDTGEGLPDASHDHGLRCRLCGVHGDEVMVRVSAAGTTTLDGGRLGDIWVIDAAPFHPQGRTLHREVQTRELPRSFMSGNETSMRARWESRVERLAHELRTPLAIVAGYQKLLLSQRVGPLNDGQRACLEESTLGCEQLDQLVRDMLEADADPSDMVPLELGEASIAASIQRVVAFLKPLLERKRLAIELGLSDVAKSGRFDVARIEQVLTNLLTNAMRYTKECSLIEIGARSVVEQGTPMIEVSVRDQGPGIASEDRRRIFEPHVRNVQQVDDVPDAWGAHVSEARGESFEQRSDPHEWTKRAHGSGLGLAICDEIVSAHEGTIEVADEGGAGCCIVFRIPIDGPSRRGGAALDRVAGGEPGGRVERQPSRTSRTPSTPRKEES